MQHRMLPPMHVKVFNDRKSSRIVWTLSSASGCAWHARGVKRADPWQAKQQARPHAMGMLQNNAGEQAPDTCDSRATTEPEKET